MKPERDWVCFQGFPDTDVSTLTSACTATLQHKAYLTLTPDQEIKAEIPHLFYTYFYPYFSPPRLFPATLASGLKQLIFYFLKETKIEKKHKKPHNGLVLNLFSEICASRILSSSCFLLPVKLNNISIKHNGLKDQDIPNTSQDANVNLS